MPPSLLPPDMAGSSPPHTYGAAKRLLSAWIPEVGQLGRKVRIDWRSLTKHIVSVLALTVLLLSVVTTAMLWVLYQVPLDSSTAFEAPAVVVEAANGEPVGRVGPLSDKARRGDFPDIL